MKTLSNQSGSINELTGEHLADVTYSLTHAGPDRAYGTIALDGDPQPGHPFMGNPAFAGGQKHYHLIATNKTKVEIWFKSSTGDFVCVMADQAKEALK